MYRVQHLIPMIVHQIWTIDAWQFNTSYINSDVVYYNGYYYYCKARYRAVTFFQYDHWILIDQCTIILPVNPSFGDTVYVADAN